MEGEVIIHDKVFVPFIHAETIQKRVKELGLQIANEYAGQRPLLIGILNGSVIFMADLLRTIDTACEIAFIRVSSYEGIKSSGSIKNLIGLSDDIEGRHVIIVEDIIDTGDTAMFLLKELRSKNPASLKFATILFKPDSLQQPMQPDYIGFNIPSSFVVGYGLDYDGLGRNLPDIYQLKSN